MPHLPYRPRPVAARETKMRTTAPLTSPVEAISDLPAIAGVDILDLDMPEMPVRTDRPDVPFAAPRRREKSKPGTLLPTISMKNHRVTPAEVAANLFRGPVDGTDPV